MARLRHIPRASSLLVATAVATGCGSAGDDRLVVFAASSLTDVFAALEEEFEVAHPNVDVVVSHDGSSSLATQIEQGAPADVFAAADEATMQRVVDEADGAPAVFATNRLAIAVEEGNPLGLTGLDDLARGDVVVVLAAPDVPAGAYAAAALVEAGVEISPASFEQSVRSVAGKVALGEADAGVVYRTDVAAQPERLDALPIETSIAAVYPIVVVDDSEPARAFVELVLGTSGRRALEAAGFEAP